MPGTSIWIALLSSTLFGLAIVANKVGLRHMSPLAGVTVSIPATAVMFTLIAPFWLHSIPWRPEALLIFACVGLFFPAFVTLLVYESNRIMGPTISSAIASTTPLFSVLGAVLILGEILTAPVVVGTAGIIFGIGVLSFGRGDVNRRWSYAALGVPLAAAAIRGVAQTFTKYGLGILPDPFLAAWMGYLVSGLTILVIARMRYGKVKPVRNNSGIRWFLVAGFCNGSAVLAMYAALKVGSVMVVTPIVATYPVLAMMLSAVALREEKFHISSLLGVVLVVGGVIAITR